MTHKDCGGEIVEDWTRTYPYTTENNLTFHCPSYKCKLCGQEILGDVDIVVTTQ